MNALLIANRGEIAARIARTCLKLGIRPVGVFAPDDVGSGHLRAVEEAVAVPGYLDVPALVEAARRSGCDAVHPGYGFLAENAAFARAVQEAGLTWVGPTPEAIEAMGDKRAARELAAAEGVPVLPGGPVELASHLGFPLMLKAAAGGGGKGMRLVGSAEDLEASLASARREAEAAFGSGELLVERALLAPRHVEVQVFGDAHGQVLVLGDRDCSLQRRHQKVIEEAPAPELPRRHELHEAALRVARAVAYQSAGTVEFLVEDDRFYFLEMNTRLQVEHPVSEEVLGLDLVEWQLRVAMGERLPAVPEERGHSVEARLYAEDPRTGLPATGPVLLFKPGPGVRVETALATGDQVSAGYDPMLAKLVAHGPDRGTALRRLGRALEQTVLLGVVSNLTQLRYLVRSLESGPLHTGWLAQSPLPVACESEPVVLAAAALAEWLESPHDFWRIQPAGAPPHRYRGPSGAVREVQLFPPLRGGSLYRLVVDRSEHRLELLEHQLPELRLALDGHYQTVLVLRQGESWWLHSLASGPTRLESLPQLPEPEPAAAPAGSLYAPMPGKVLEVLVAAGDEVEAGAALLKLEAMKMEHTVLAPRAGRVDEVHYAAGDTVEAEALLISLS